MQPSDQPQTIPALLEGHSRRAPDSIALVAPGCKPLTYNDLYKQIEQTVAALNRLGIGRGDRVAVVLPDVPEMAVALLAVGAGATVMPLNPAMRREDYEYLLTKSGACAVLIEPNSDSLAKAVAEALNLQMLELVPTPDAPAGMFTIGGTTNLPPNTTGFAQPGDVMQFITTSGTTGRPKLVPRTHQGWCYITRIWSDAFAMTADDRLL